MRYAFLSLLLLFIVGCTGNTPATTPSPEHPAPESGLTLTDRNGTIDATGKIMLAGSVANNTVNEKSPYKFELPVKSGQLLVISFTATHAPASTRNCLLRVMNQSNALVTSRTAPGNGGLVQLAVWVTTNETFSVQFYNAASSTGAVHPDVLTWEGSLRLEQYTSFGGQPEPDSDNIQTTRMDDGRHNRGEIGINTGWSSFTDSLWFRDTGHRDQEDWYYGFWTPGFAAEAQVIPHAAPGEVWTYNARLVDPDGNILAENMAFTTATTLVATENNHQSIYLQVWGAPLNQSPPSNRAYYSAYTVHLRQTPGLDGVSITGFTPAQQTPLGRPGQLVELGVLTDGAPVLGYDWDAIELSGIDNRIFTTSRTIAHPIIELPGPGEDYTIQVELTTATGTQFGSLDFTVGFQAPQSFAAIPSPGGGLEVGDCVDVIALTDGDPAICYRDSVNEDLYFARAFVPDPDGPQDWWSFRVAGANGADVGQYCQMALINDAPVIAHYNDTYDTLSLARSLVPEPNAATDFVNIPVDQTGGGQWPAITSQGQRIVVVHRGSGGDLRYSKANIASPTLRTDFTTYSLDFGPDTGYGNAVGFSGDKLLVGTLARQGAGANDPWEVRLWVAKNTAPAAIGNWAWLTDFPDASIGPRANVEALGSLSIAQTTLGEDGRVLIGCYDSAAGGYRIWTGYRPTSSEGWSGFYPPSFLAATGTWTGSPDALGIQQGRPALVLRNIDTHQSRFGRASNPLALQKSNWLFVQPPYGGDQGIAPFHSRSFTGAIGGNFGGPGLSWVRIDDLSW